MGAPVKYKEEFCDIATEILASGKSLAAVCAKLDIARPTLYEWRDTYPEFRNAISRGLDRCQAYWEEIGHSGITGGYEKFSATPWIFTMKNRFRADYAEEKDVKSDNAVLIEKLIDKLVD